jgi:acetylornithine deacetylase/succinyl-diaminopimelate desuccinylase-like protein
MCYPFSMPDGERIAEWLSRLVRIPSVNPAQAGPRSGDGGESRITDAIAEWFRELGGEVRRQEVLPGRRNVYGIWEGTGSGWAAVDAHVDTVGVEVMTGDPFSGDIADGRVYGRGAVDTKATLAVVLALLEDLHGDGRRPVPNLLIAATVDEEVTAHGAPAFANWVRSQDIALDQLAVAEPTLCGPVVAHKGITRVVFRVHGKPSHSSQPHLGSNAIVAGAALVTALQAEHERLQTAPPTMLGHGSLAVTEIRGGIGANVIPAECWIGTDRRLLPGEDPDRTAEALIEIARRHCPLPFDAEVTLRINAFHQNPDTPWLRQLTEWSGREPAVVPYGTNAWAYGGLARETAVIGPGSIDQAHGVEEWVEISELEKLAAIYSRWWGIS